MSEYLHVEKPFLDQLAALGWEVVDQGCGHVPADPAASLRTSFRQWLLPEVFREAVQAINQFRIDTPGALKKCIIPDIVLFVNGMPLGLVECKIGGPTCANPMHEAFIQLLR